MYSISKKMVLPAAAAMLMAFGGPALRAQTPTPAPPPTPRTPTVNRPAVPPRPPVVARVPTQRAAVPGIDSEQRIEVDPGVSFKFCIAEGRLVVNGWDRDEIRVFIRNGREFRLRVLEKARETGKPNWVWATSAAAEPAGTTSECISGSSIEIDMPRKSTLNVNGRSAEAEIAAIGAVTFKNVEGGIWLRDISGGIMASTHRGDLMVESSSGSITLENTTGNIVAFDVGPGRVGDIFRAKTNSGSISIQQAEHRQIDASSITGTVGFDGRFMPGGIYSFRTSNGAIRLDLPEDSSCKIVASYGFGSITSAIPWNIETELISSGGNRVIATIGSGEATVNITTTTGSISIRPQN
jgi:hypothetical protein